MNPRKLIRNLPSKSVSLRGGVVDYQDDRLGISESDRDQMLPPTWERAFQDGANRVEGVSGVMPIDTTYENTTQAMVDMPRSDMGERPYPRRIGKPNHEGVGNPAPICTDMYNYPHRYEN